MLLSDDTPALLLLLLSAARGCCRSSIVDCSFYAYFVLAIRLPISDTCETLLVLQNARPGAAD
jgi:hypothetical protein